MRANTFDVDTNLDIQAKLLYAKDKITQLHNQLLDAAELEYLLTNKNKWLQNQNVLLVRALDAISTVITSLRTQMVEATASPADTIGTAENPFKAV